MLPASSLQRIWNLSPATLSELRNEFDSALGTVSGNIRRTLHSPAPLTVFEADDGVTLEVDVPGIPGDAIEISVEDGVLTVIGSRPTPDCVGKLKHCERPAGSIRRSVQLDETLDTQAITADLSNGVLRIVVARKSEAQPRKVVVKIRSDETASPDSVNSTPASHDSTNGETSEE